MRTVRWMTSVLALLALMPTVGAAQSSRLFQDSWFWGAKAGLVSFSTNAAGNTAAPSVGAEWMITGSHAGLYLSGEQAFFNTSSSVLDASAQPHRVAIRDMRRYTLAALAFPASWGTIKPYGGLGFSMNLIQRAVPIDPAPDATVSSNILGQKDRTSFITMGGIQAQYRRISIFGQATYMPAKSNFLLNGRPTYIVESGIRYNFGTSRESGR